MRSLLHMREVIRALLLDVRAPDGSVYTPRVLGEENADGRWEGFIEFIRTEDGDAVFTSRETTQNERRDLDRWAEGLGAPWFQGALQRALRQRTTFDSLHPPFLRR